MDKKLFSELQAQYCAVPDSGKCPCYNVGDEFMFYRNDERDDYWHMGAGTLIKSGKPDEGVLLSPGTMHCGTDGVPFCSEAWDAISRYIYSALFYQYLSEKDSEFLINNNYTKEAAKEVVGEEDVVSKVPAPNMAGEDFAYYLQKAPGAFFFLSSSNPVKHTDVPHHNPHFNVDEDVLYKGSAMFVKIVEAYLK